MLEYSIKLCERSALNCKAAAVLSLREADSMLGAAAVVAHKHSRNASGLLWPHQPQVKCGL